MAQTTLDRVSERVRELADRTGEATNQALESVLPARRRRRTTRRMLRGRITRRLGLWRGVRAGKATPAAVQTAWQAGEIAGRLGGIAATIPNMTRLWLDRSMAQVRGQPAASGAKTAARTAPAGIASLRLRGRAQVGSRQRRPANIRRTREMLSARVDSFARQAAIIAAASGGVAALNKRLSTVGDRLNLTTGRAVPNRARKTMRQTAKTTPRSRLAWRGRALMRGGTRRVVNPLEGTQRRLRQSWRWARLFTLGFAVGAIWAYLFAPRRPSAEEQQESARQRSATIEKQRTAAEM